MRTQIRHTANRIATCSDSKRIRTQNARSIQRSDVDTWGFSSSVAWQSFEVVPNVIAPTSTTCERVVHHPAVVHYYVFCVFPSIIYNKCSLPALCHLLFPPSLPPSLSPSLPPSLALSFATSLPLSLPPSHPTLSPSLPPFLLPSLPPPPLRPSLSEGTYQSPNQQHCIRFFFLCMGDYFHSQSITRHLIEHRPVAATWANSAPFTY